MTFSVDDSKRSALQVWKSNHLVDPACPHSKGSTGAIGGQFTYSFTPTHLGTICKATCNCGAEFDATDYDW